MQVGILGSGIVGQTLGFKLVQLGYNVMLGTRDPEKLDEPKGRGSEARSLRDWLTATGAGASVGTFRDTATHGELVINALAGAASLEVLNAIGELHLNGKILVDTSCPIDFSRGLPRTLFVKDTDSLAEMLQRAFPEVRVVKTLNTMSVALMANPALVGNGDHTIFLSGNDPEAKARVVEILREFGWNDILDLGNIATARGTEMLLPLGFAVMHALGPVESAFKVVR